MGKGPITINRITDGNGKKTVMVREREYQLKSWDGVKTIGSFVAAIIGVAFAVLTAYYTAEASQNEKIAEQEKNITRIDEREDERHNATSDIFTRMNDTLDRHQDLMQKTNDTLIEVHTTQKHIQKQVDQMSDDVKQLRKP